MAKDLSFEAKDFKMCPRGQEPPRRPTSVSKILKTNAAKVQQ